MSYICRKEIPHMKVNRSSNSNLRFLYGSVFFFAVLILTMVLFTYYAMGEATKSIQAQMFSYTISFSDDFQGGECEVFFDDSLIFARGNVAPGASAVVHRRTISDTLVIDGKTTVSERVLFSPESVLRVVDAVNADTVAVTVGDNSRIGISRPDGKISISLAE